MADCCRGQELECCTRNRTALCEITCYLGWDCSQLRVRLIFHMWQNWALVCHQESFLTRPRWKQVMVVLQFNRGLDTVLENFLFHFIYLFWCICEHSFVFWFLGENPFTFFFLHIQPPRCPLLLLPLHRENTFSSRFDTIDFNSVQGWVILTLSDSPSLSLSLLLLLSLYFSTNVLIIIQLLPAFSQSRQVKLHQISASCMQSLFAQKKRRHPHEANGANNID